MATWNRKTVQLEFTEPMGPVPEEFADAAIGILRPVAASNLDEFPARELLFAHAKRSGRRKLWLLIIPWCMALSGLLFTAIAASLTDANSPVVGAAVVFTVSALLFATISLIFGRRSSIQWKALRQLLNDNIILAFELPKGANYPSAKKQQNAQIPARIHVGYPSQVLIEAALNQEENSYAGLTTAPEVEPMLEFRSEILESATPEQDFLQRDMTPREKEELQDIIKRVPKITWHVAVAIFFAIRFFMRIGNANMKNVEGRDYFNIAFAVIALIFVVWAVAEIWKQTKRRAVLNIDLQNGQIIIVKSESGEVIEFLPNSGLVWTAGGKATGFRGKEFVPKSVQSNRDVEDSDVKNNLSQP